MAYKVHKGNKYTSAKEMELVINKYFADTPEDMVTLSGLCIALGIQKSTLYHYANMEPFQEIVNMARLCIEHSYEMSLRKNGRTGDIFALKNFGWSDKQDVDINASVEDSTVVVKVVSPTNEDIERVKNLKEGLFKNDN